MERHVDMYVSKVARCQLYQIETHSRGKALQITAASFENSIERLDLFACFLVSDVSALPIRSSLLPVAAGADTGRPCQSTFRYSLHNVSGQSLLAGQYQLQHPVYIPVLR
jgi:hypothetical protein